ncbi:beta-galactosidase [Streptomyces hirsutus]|uniref:beta-galactosidase n=1 Tax=Streptomyces hirsutus TaxID=35620 RepID=UPI0033C22369
MAHSGTNFGRWAGAHHDGDTLQPTATSYDSDAPIAEHGAPTPKFHAFRDLLHTATGAPRRPLPADLPLLSSRTAPVTAEAALLGALRAVSDLIASPPHATALACPGDIRPAGDPADRPLGEDAHRFLGDGAAAVGDKDHRSAVGS